MTIGVALPTNRVRLGPRELRRIVDAVEVAGCGSVWVNDHLAAFPVGTEHYPYSPTGTIDWDPHAPQYEALSACGFLLGATDRLRVGTSVLVLPQRNPLEVAKSAATLADFGAGRFVLGVGAGWSRREMTLLGWDPATRGARMNEQLDLLRACWDPGRRWPETVHHRIPEDVIVEPVPRPADVPPLLIGGTSPAALRRVRERGDGWLAVSGPQPDRVRAAGRLLAELRAGTSRPLSAVLKVALPSADVARAAGVLDRAADDGWDEISFEFGDWDLDRVRGLLETCVERRGALGAGI